MNNNIIWRLIAIAVICLFAGYSLVQTIQQKATKSGLSFVGCTSDYDCEQMAAIEQAKEYFYYEQKTN